MYLDPVERVKKQQRWITMRPKMPDSIVNKLDENPDEVDLDNLFEVGGFQSKGEFIRAAVREKISRTEEAIGVESEWRNDDRT